MRTPVTVSRSVLFAVPHSAYLVHAKERVVSLGESHGLSLWDVPPQELNRDKRRDQSDQQKEDDQVHETGETAKHEQLFMSFRSSGTMICSPKGAACAELR